MKRNVFLLTLVLFVLNISAQDFNETNSLKRKALVLYQMDGIGFYYKNEKVAVPTTSTKMVLASAMSADLFSEF